MRKMILFVLSIFSCSLIASEVQKEEQFVEKDGETTSQVEKTL